MKPLYGMMLGAGVKSTIVGFVRNMLGSVGGNNGLGTGLAGISDDILAIGIGYVIQSRMKGTMQDVGAGIFIAGGAGLIEGVVAGMPILGGNAVATRATTTAVRRAPTAIGGSLEQAAAAL